MLTPAQSVNRKAANAFRIPSPSPRHCLEAGKWYGNRTVNGRTTSLRPAGSNGLHLSCHTRHRRPNQRRPRSHQRRLSGRPRRLSRHWQRSLSQSLSQSQSQSLSLSLSLSRRHRRLSRRHRRLSRRHRRLSLRWQRQIQLIR